MPSVKPAMARPPARDDARPRTGTVQAPTALLIGMDPLDVTVRSILSLAAPYKPGTIVRAERVLDEYRDDFRR